jgi:hypothetical protein
MLGDGEEVGMRCGLWRWIVGSAMYCSMLIER